MPSLMNVDGVGEIEIPDNYTDLQALQKVLYAKQEAGQIDGLDSQIAELDGMVEQAYGYQEQQEEPTGPVVKRPPNRGYFMEALAGLKSGALGTTGAGLSGAERIAEVLDLDPTEDKAGWLRQAGEYLKAGADEIKASPDKEGYFKFFNAFGSILGFIAPSLAVGVVSGPAAIGVGAALAAGTGSDEAYERAVKAGANPEQIKDSTLLGTGLGITEVATPLRLYKQIKKIFPSLKYVDGEGLGTTSTQDLIKKTTKSAQEGRLANVLGITDTPFKEFGKRVGMTVGLEGSQEFAAAVGQNAIERYIYNPDKELLNADAIEEGLYGGSAGGALEAIISTFALRKSRGYRKKMDEFLESKEFKAIETEADKAAKEVEEVDTAIKDAFGEGATFEQIVNSGKYTNEERTAARALFRRKERIEQKLRRSNSLMEKALNDSVYTSNEILSYLADQKDDKGNLLYDPDYLRRLAKEDKENNTSFIKDTYVKHVNDRRVKHEKSIEDSLSAIVNPKVFLNQTDEQKENKESAFYSAAEIEQLKAEYTGKGAWKDKLDVDALETEVNNRFNDAVNKETKGNYQLQQDRIDLRSPNNELRLSQKALANLYGNENEAAFSAAFIKDILERVNQSQVINQFNLMMNELNAGEEVSSYIKKAIDFEKYQLDYIDLTKKVRMTLEDPNFKPDEAAKILIPAIAKLKADESKLVEKLTNINPVDLFAEGIKKDGKKDDVKEPVTDEVEEGTDTETGTEEGATDVVEEEGTDVAVEEEGTDVKDPIKELDDMEAEAEAEIEQLEEELKEIALESIRRIVDIMDSTGQSAGVIGKAQEAFDSSEEFDSISLLDILVKRMSDYWERFNTEAGNNELFEDTLFDSDKNGKMIPNSKSNQSMREFREHLIKELSEGEIFVGDKYIKIKDSIYEKYLKKYIDNKTKGVTIEDILGTFRSAQNNLDDGIKKFLEENPPATVQQELQQISNFIKENTREQIFSQVYTNDDFQQIKDNENEMPTLGEPEIRQKQDRIVSAILNSLGMASGAKIVKNVSTDKDGSRSFEFSKSEKGDFNLETGERVPDLTIKFENKAGKTNAGTYNSATNTLTLGLEVLKYPEGTKLKDGRDIWQELINTTYHEAYHAARRLLFTPEQNRIFNKVLTIDLARKNGWSTPYMTKSGELVDTQELYRKIAEQRKGFLAELDVSPEEQRREAINFMTEEAQAWVAGRWAAGYDIIDLTPQARSLFKIIEDFLKDVGRAVKSIILKDPSLRERPVNWDEMVRDQLRDFTNGTLAEMTAERDAVAGASLAMEFMPANSTNVLGATLDEILKATKYRSRVVGKDDNGQDMMRDISGWGRIFSHLSAIAEKSREFRTFYNGLQDRVMSRNSIKQAAEILLEKVGDYRGIFNLSREDFVKVQNLSTIADEAIAEPKFENLNTENATATIQFNQSDLDQIKKTYTTLEKFYEDANIDPSVIEDSVRIVTDEEGNQTKQYTIRVTDPKIVNAFAGSSLAISSVHEQVSLGILHNLLNTKGLKSTNLGIETGQGYDRAFADLKKIMATIKKKGLSSEKDGVNVLDAEKWDAYRKANKNNKDKLLDGLDYEQANRIFRLFNVMLEEGRAGYFPRYRFGDKGVAVYRNVSGTFKGKTQEGQLVRDKTDYELIRVEVVPDTSVERIGNLPGIGEAAKTNVERKRQELLKTVQAEYGDQIGEQYIVEPLDLTLDQLRRGDDALRDSAGIARVMGKVSMLAEIIKDQDPKSKISGSGEGKSELDRMFEIIENEISLSRAESLTRPRKGIPGYLNRNNNDGRYYKQAIQRYVDTGSNTASSLYEEPKIIRAINNIREKVQGGEQSNLYKVAQKTFEYVNDANNEATMLRGYAFHMFLGFNLSSAVINLTQTVQATYPILSSITGMAKGAGDVAKAQRDAIRLFKHMVSDRKQLPRTGKYGFEFYTTVTDEAGVTKVVVDPSRKPKWMDEKEFLFLADLFKRGSIQPIQNMDLGSGYLSQNLNNNLGRILADASGFGFGLIENSNRITAALAFYRSAKRDALDPKSRKRWDAFSGATRFANPRVDSNGQPLDIQEADLKGVTETISPEEAWARRMGEMGVEKTQFFMGKENRPTLFRGPVMSAVTQFQSFLFQMMGLYATAFNRSLGARLEEVDPDQRDVVKSMARKQLGLMTLTMMGFGGVMGLPFMENVKQMIKFITENFGDEVGEDIEQGLREVIGPIMGYDPTDMLLRGLPRGLGIDISRRSTYGDVIPLRLVMGGDPADFTGPAISRIIDQVAGINNALERGESSVEKTLGVLQNLVPVAVGNLTRALINEQRSGTLTQRGQQLLPADALSGGQMFTSMLGFTPTKVARARERRGLENYYNYRAKNGKDMYSNRMSISLGNYYNFMRKGKVSKAMDNYRKFLQDYQRVTQHDLRNQSNPSKKYNINFSTINKRALRSLGLTEQAGPRVRKDVRREIDEGRRRGYIPPVQG